MKMTRIAATIMAMVTSEETYVAALGVYSSLVVRFLDGLVSFFTSSPNRMKVMGGVIG